MSRPLKKPGGGQREGVGEGGGRELWQEPLKPDRSPVLCATPAARFHVNINGFLHRQQDHTLQFTVGNEVRGPDSRGTWVEDSRLGPQLLPTPAAGPTYRVHAAGRAPGGGLH